ncbi:MAG: 8-oxo-dGTP diphosphatase MutT [Phototrophicaceae bacterium]
MLKHSALAVILDETRSKILLQKREDFRVWDVPGGMVEESEDYADAAVRESYEETGLIVEIIRHVGDYSRPQAKKVAHLYECRVIGGEIIKQGYETVDVDWFPIDDLPKRCTPPTQKYLDATLANHAEPIQETLTYSTWLIIVWKLAIKLRNLRNRFLR